MYTHMICVSRHFRPDVAACRQITESRSSQDAAAAAHAADAVAGGTLEASEPEVVADSPGQARLGLALHVLLRLGLIRFTALCCHAMLCYAMLCHVCVAALSSDWYAMLLDATPCYGLLCHAMPCHAMLLDFVPCFRMVRYVVLYGKI